MADLTRKPTRLDTVCNNFAFIHNEALLQGFTVKRGAFKLLSVSTSVLHIDFELLSISQGSHLNNMTVRVHSLPPADKIVGKTQEKIRFQLISARTFYASTPTVADIPSSEVPLSILVKDNVARFLHESQELKELLETEYARAAINATRGQLGDLCSNSSP